MKFLLFKINSLNKNCLNGDYSIFLLRENRHFLKEKLFFIIF